MVITQILWICHYGDLSLSVLLGLVQTSRNILGSPLQHQNTPEMTASNYDCIEYLL